MSDLIDTTEMYLRTIYELIFNNTSEVMFRTTAAPTGPPPVVQSSDCLKMVGFGKDEGILPYQPHSFLGYRLLTEYFSFPAKFLFFDVAGLEQPVLRSGFDTMTLSPHWQSRNLMPSTNISGKIDR